MSIIHEDFSVSLIRYHTENITTYVSIIIDNLLKFSALIQVHGIYTKITFIVDKYMVNLDTNSSMFDIYIYTYCYCTYLIYI